MATHNGERWLPEQLLSVVTQEHVEVDLLISDDRSTDGTPDLLQAFAAASSNVRVLPTSVDGGSASANFLRLFREADLSGCKYVALCDQDDTWTPGKLHRATSMLAETGAAAYSSAVTAEWPDGRCRLLSQSPHQTPFDFLFEGAGQGCTFVCRSAFMERVQRFALDHAQILGFLHYHDWLMYALARIWHEAWIFDPRPSLRYRQHGHNDTGARGNIKGSVKRIRMLASGWYTGQLDVVYSACLAASPADGRLKIFQRWRQRRSTFGCHMLWSAWLLFFSRRKLVDRITLCTMAALRFL